jgi:hypothetical protein
MISHSDVLPQTTSDPPINPTGLGRRTWAVLGILLIVSAVIETAARHVSPSVGVAFAVGPDLSFIAGLGRPAEPGRLPVKAVPVYNLVHRHWLPVAVIAAAGLAHLPPWCLVAGLAWWAHITVDRAFGFGLRATDGGQRD